CLSFHCYGHHRSLHSFPTRRSSDLSLYRRHNRSPLPEVDYQCLSLPAVDYSSFLRGSPAFLMQTQMNSRAVECIGLWPILMYILAVHLHPVPIDASVA